MKRTKKTRWSTEEVNFLKDNWGKYKLPVIAQKLNRTEKAVLIKAKRLGIGPSRSGQGLLTARELARTLGVDAHTIIDYWIPCGLKANQKVTKSKFAYWQINTTDWWQWAKQNQDKFDSRRIEPLILGPEPEWMENKRQSDKHLPRRRLQRWTPADDAKLHHFLVTTKLTYGEIGEKLGRSENAVSKRLSRIAE